MYQSTTTGDSKRTTLSFFDLISNGWFQTPEASSVWISGYRMFRVPNEQLSSLKMIDLQHVRIVFIRGSITYTDFSGLSSSYLSDSHWTLDASNVTSVTSPEGTYLIAIAPLAIDGDERPEASVKDDIRSALGLIAAFYTKAAIFQHLFDQIFHIGTKQTSGFGPVMQNLSWFPPIDLEGETLATIEAINYAISNQPSQVQNRIYLALRWIHAAAVEEDSVDCLLKYWVAIETLAISEGTNIYPANEYLAKGYGISIQEATDIFRLGRLFGVRSNIVHNGMRPAVHGHLLRYMEYLFSDLLSVILGIRCPQRAQVVIDEAWADLSAYLGQR